MTARLLHVKQRFLTISLFVIPGTNDICGEFFLCKPLLLPSKLDIRP